MQVDEMEFDDCLNMQTTFMVEQDRQFTEQKQQVKVKSVN